MKNIINHIVSTVINTFKSKLKLTSTKKTGLICNYSNNYYGDQYCQTKLK
ncbi:hypothetical protein GAB14E_1326 [Colwellia psychrerythraea]|uniref:Uncharacterized protein n=1 Tax=Colwellia psychrerythraea TaxID=28229 RepID=A0A099L4Q2_COLPS|nr:hypothetical protein GAB14E_1326 [Colwellia psychrerythraea]